MSVIWKPAAYHGARATPPFFEGWYFKLVTADGSRRYAVIPGIFQHQEGARTHAFVQVLDGLKAGERIVVHAGKTLSERSRIRIVDTLSSGAP